MKRVLILSASVGSGHQAAASALEQVFRQADEVEVINQDALALTTDTYRAIAADAYTTLVRESPWLIGWWYDAHDLPFKNEGLIRRVFDLLNAQQLVRFIKQFDPHISVCTHFMPAGIIAQLMAQKELNTALAIVTTDYDFHGMWLSQTFNRYFVALEETRAHLMTLGIPEQHITVSGIPISPAFSQPVDRAAVLAHYQLDPERPLLLISAGAVGGGPAREIVLRVMQLQHDVQAVVICGRNEQLRCDIEAMVFPQVAKFRVLGYSTDMPRLMRVATLFIGKPGGLTSSECMASGLPMVIVSPIPGQEERNSNHLLEQGAAVRCNDVATLTFKLDRLLADPERLQRMRANTHSLGRPDAAQVIVQTLLSGRLTPLRISRTQQRRMIEAARGIVRTERSQRETSDLIALYHDQTGVLITAIPRQQFRLLRRRMVPTGPTTYTLPATMIATLRQDGLPPDILHKLERALANDEAITLRRIRL